MKEIPSYGSIFAIGHRETASLFDDPVWVEEKLDGSQGSVMFDGEELLFKSKSKMLVADAPEKMFAPWVEAMQAIHREHGFLPGYIYRGEVLTKAKHNTLAYARTPAHHFMVFDIDAGGCDYMHPDNRAAECARLGLESIPVYHVGKVEGLADLARLLDRESCLGGPKIEGVVVKSPTKLDAFKHRLTAKYVSEAFKERNGVDFKERNPGRHDVVQRLISDLKTTARWRKAIQHLRDEGLLTDSPKDIGLLVREIPADIRRECEAEIKEALFAWAFPNIARGVISGFPEWYKQECAASTFTGDGEPR